MKLVFDRQNGLHEVSENEQVAVDLYIHDLRKNVENSPLWSNTVSMPTYERIWPVATDAQKQELTRLAVKHLNDLIAHRLQVDKNKVKSRKLTEYQKYSAAMVRTIDHQWLTEMIQSPLIPEVSALAERLLKLKTQK
ncbi:hypothetical protein [Schleiferilactobacillus harbinensis]|jgi:hypothetical protein|uniref:hypothetical protein n=1 Tax=Schleiferilactobacillus harbinensis TaxID=304207 RepID=UPI00242C4E11|nr:hypothetical protein [Schleiferilactobacillus harbinensis]MCI1687854.1 hypothetical protein [Schleiferilactobacillus harbinensis]MCI1784127.1 hypothetical protein [Schleiferilactobacillus harbinensis]MCI1849219.1 hypothetical protein [Schleiferilactobacillus harbinensis]